VATNFDAYAPFDAGPGANVTEDTWRAMMRRGNIAGVVKNVTNELNTFGDSTGMQVKVDTGECVIESYWGQNNSIKTLGITSNSSGFTRIDTVVARANWVDNTVEFDVLVGTPNAPTGPLPTRDNTKWEIPLGLVVVANGAVTIASTAVFDMRQWGGPPVMTVTDDYSLYADKLSSCRRFDVNGEIQVANGNLYVSRMHSLGEQVCSKIRLCVNVLPVAGTTTVRIFRGFRYDNITSFIDPTTSTFLYGGTAGTVHESTFTPTLFRAGETICIGVLGLSTTTAAQLAQNQVPGAVNMSGFLNPGTVSVTMFKSSVASMPTGFNLSDGSWFKRDRVFWAALA
jgi:hypothetical protein